MTRSAVADIREAALLRQREELRAELLELAKHYTRQLNWLARNSTAVWRTDLESRRATRIAYLLRRMGVVQGRLWRMHQAVNA